MVVVNETVRRSCTSISIGYNGAHPYGPRFVATRFAGSTLSPMLAVGTATTPGCQPSFPFGWEGWASQIVLLNRVLVQRPPPPGGPKRGLRSRRFHTVNRVGDFRLRAGHLLAAAVIVEGSKFVGSPTYDTISPNPAPTFEPSVARPGASPVRGTCRALTGSACGRVQGPRWGQSGISFPPPSTWLPDADEGATPGCRPPSSTRRRWWTAPSWGVHGHAPARIFALVARRHLPVV